MHTSNSIKVDLTQSNLYFTGDPHLGHGNIIQHCNRPFQNSDHMDQVLIGNYQEVISDDDIVCILGDVMYKSSCTPTKYLDQLPGQKYLIMGNHDYSWIQPEHKKYFEDIRESMFVKVFPDGGSECIPMYLHHYACRTWPNRHYGSYHLYGHSHSNLENRLWPGSFDVGVDCWNYYPIDFWKVQENIKKIEKLHNKLESYVYK